VRDAKEISELLRVEQAADFLNVKPSTIRAWLLKRRLPKVKVGDRCVRIPRQALEELIAENTVPTRQRRR
jgi:excisionase family DNA binding protein